MNLIDDVFKAFGLRLGVIDLTTLAHLALRAMRDGVTINARQRGQLASVRFQRPSNGLNNS